MFSISNMNCTKVLRVLKENLFVRIRLQNISMVTKSEMLKMSPLTYGNVISASDKYRKNLSFDKTIPPGKKLMTDESS